MAATKKAQRRASPFESIPGGKYSVGALVVGALGGLIAWLASTGGKRFVAGQPLTPGAQDPATAHPSAGAEHVPTDLMGDSHPGPGERAADPFRPDPTAPIPEDERDAFRPALDRPTMMN